MATTDNILSYVVRHDETLRNLEKDLDSHDKEIQGVGDELHALRLAVNARFDRQQWFTISTLVGVVMMLVGVIVDLILSLH